jgi:serine/threonine protein kinase
MHSEPFPVYHRDIRRPNILRRRDNDKWFLIDWSDASTTPTHAALHLSKEGHSPRVHEDNHGAEVDIWGIGYYLKELASRSRPADAYGLEQIGKRWMEDYTATAEAALDEIKVCSHPSFVIVY